MVGKVLFVREYVVSTHLAFVLILERSVRVALYFKVSITLDIQTDSYGRDVTKTTSLYTHAGH